MSILTFRTKAGGRSSDRGFGSSAGISTRRFARAAARYAASLGLVVLAVSTACAPVARTAHVSSVTPYQPDEKSYSKFTINTGGSSLDADDNVSAKLEVLFEGQKL